MQKGLLTAEHAAGIDAKQVFSLLFQAGFSTAENVTKDAGRGIGMNLIAERVREAGGRVSRRDPTRQIHADLGVAAPRRSSVST